MPRTKTQGIIFGLIMSYAMAIGMEVYNIAIKMGFNLNMGSFSSMTNAVFPAALVEASYMGLFVFLFSNLYGNRAGAAFAAKVSDPGRDNPYFCQLMRQAGTIAVMCPTMSIYPVQCDPGQAADHAAPGDLGRNGHQELSHGLLLEHVCRRALHALDLREAVRHGQRRTENPITKRRLRHKKRNLRFVMRGGAVR